MIKKENEQGIEYYSNKTRHDLVQLIMMDGLCEIKHLWHEKINDYIGYKTNVLIKYHRQYYLYTYYLENEKRNDKDNGRYRLYGEMIRVYYRRLYDNYSVAECIYLDSHHNTPYVESIMPHYNREEALPDDLKAYGCSEVLRNMFYSLLFQAEHRIGIIEGEEYYEDGGYEYIPANNDDDELVKDPNW